MLFIVLETVWKCIWVFLKPALFVLIPVILAFSIAFFIAYKKKVKTGTAHRIVLAHKNPNADVGLFTKLFVQLPYQYWENYYNKKIGAFDEHGIILYTGRQGMGKTIAMTRDILNLRYQYPSLKVGTNYGLNDEDFVIDDWKNLVNYNNGEYGVLCAIDECQNWFSSRLSKNFPPRMLATVTQNRKNRRVIMMTSHFFTNVSKPIRQHCTEERSCLTFFGCFTVVTRYRLMMNGDGDLVSKRRIGRYCFVHSNELYNSYDTYRVIKNLSDAGFDADTWAEDNDTSVSRSLPLKKSIGRRKHNVEQEVMKSIDDCYKLIDGRG